MDNPSRRTFLQLPAVAACAAVLPTGAEPATPAGIWYDRPAAKWEEALAIGNGRLGAMIFGGIEKERLQLNEITIWSGQLEDKADRPEAYKGLASSLRKENIQRPTKPCWSSGPARPAAGSAPEPTGLISRSAI